MASATPWAANVQTQENQIDTVTTSDNQQTQTPDDRTGTATTTTLSVSEKTDPKDDGESSSKGSSEENERRVTELVREFTRRSVQSGPGLDDNPFLGSDHPELNPSSGKFNAKAWIKTLIGITSRDPDRYPGRTAGVSYRNLNVHGFGNPTDYQKTFGNYPLEAKGLFDRLRGHRGQRKIQILRDFDGLVKSGEMLVVLGRPGSGCSTLLKTISGETNGFFVDSKSEINYQGS